MPKDIFKTVHDLLDNSDEVLMSNAVHIDGHLYEDSVENLTALLAFENVELVEEFEDCVWVKIDREDWEALNQDASV